MSPNTKTNVKIIFGLVLFTIILTSGLLLIVHVSKADKAEKRNIEISRIEKLNSNVILINTQLLRKNDLNKLISRMADRGYVPVKYIYEEVGWDEILTGIELRKNYEKTKPE